MLESRSRKPTWVFKLVKKALENTVLSSESEEIPNLTKNKKTENGSGNKTILVPMWEEVNT
jgi:hypothetical protein